MLLFFIDQGHYAYADGAYLDFNSATLENNNIRTLYKVDYNQPLLLNTFEDSNNNKQYLWQYDIYVSYPSQITGYYNIFSKIYLNFNYPSNANLYQCDIVEVDSTSNHNVELFSFAYSNVNKYIRTAFNIFSNNIYMQNGYYLNLIHFKINVLCNNSVAPNISVSQYENTNFTLYNGEDLEQTFIAAINNSTSARDIGLILTQAQNMNVNLQHIISYFIVNNNTLTSISDYAYRIWNILNAQYPTSASEALSDAQDNLESINQDIINYSPPTVSDQQIITDGQSAYMSMQLEGDTDNLFWYLNWGVILSLVTLIFSLAIISYIIYGKYS